MLARIAATLKKLSLLGAPQDNPELYKRVLFSNRISVTLGLTCVFYCGLYAAFGVYQMAFAIMLGGLSFLPILGLNSLGKYRIAGYLNVIAPCNTILLFCYLLGHEVGVQYIFIPMVGVPFIVCSRRDRIGLIASALFPMICFFAVTFTFAAGLAPAPLIQLPWWTKHSCIFTCFIIAGLLFYHFANTLGEVHDSIQKTLEKEVAARTSELQQMSEFLEEKVKQRTNQLMSSFQELQHEISEKRKTEAELRMASELFVQIGNDIDGILWVTSLDGSITHYVSPTVEKLFGHSPEAYKLNSKLWADSIHPEDRDFVVEAFKALEGGSYTAVYRVVHAKDGSVRWISSRGSIANGPDGKPSRIVGVSIDVTQQKWTEQELANQQIKMVTSSRLSALGEMASSIGHEINNPLAIICAKAGQLRDMANDESFDRKSLDAMGAKIENTALRISRIIKSLRTYARDATDDPFEKARLGVIVSDTLELCSHRLKSQRVNLQIEAVQPDIEIECRPVQISQVLVNLLNNAIDAVDPVPDRWIRIVVKDLGESVEISVVDSGAGIPEPLREKILEPFFTTKAVGKGTGLGLSVSKGIVSAHGGIFTLDPHSPHTRFMMSLPKRQNQTTKLAA